MIAFYTQHVRIWAAVAEDGKGGKLLWMGGTTNKNRDRFQAKFEQHQDGPARRTERRATATPTKDMKRKTLTQA